MPSTINADNGVVSGSSGVKTTADTSGELALQSNGVTGLTLTTGLNVGIGTTTPSSKLVVSQGSGAFQAVQILSSNPAEDAGLRLQGGGGNAFRIQQPSGARGLFFYDETATATRMTIDASGNLGLGVTPSAWGASFKALDVQGRTAFASGAVAQPLVAYNAFNNGTNWIYKNSVAASFTEQVAGEHRWFTAPSGTAGNAISFTQAMTLDASGNLGVGTTSPAYRFDVRTSGTNDVAFIVTSAGGGSRILFSDGNTGTQASAPRIGGNANDLLFYTNTSGNNSTERARITNTGAWSFGSSGTATGTSGQVLTSNGSGSAPSWQTPGGGAGAFVAFGSTGGL